MNKTQYLNEEKYQKTKNKITIVASLVLVIGLLVGSGLIATGLMKYSQAKLSTEEINQVQIEIDSYNTQLSSLKAQKSQEFKNNGFSEKYYNLDNQIEKVEDKIEMFEDKLDPDVAYLFAYYMLGGIIIVFAAIFSVPLYVTANGREIIAFHAQQQMPVTKEGIETIAPTVGNAAGEIVKGIRKGLKDEDK